MAGLRRSEAVEIEWRDVTDAREEGGLLIAVRRSKTNPDSVVGLSAQAIK